VAAEHAVAFPKLGPVTVKPFQSRQKAQLDLIKAEREQLAKLTDIFGIPENQLKFIIEAWSQVGEELNSFICRSVQLQLITYI